MLSVDRPSISHDAEMVRKMQDILIYDSVPDMNTRKVNYCIIKSLTPTIKKNQLKFKWFESALCKGITSQDTVMKSPVSLIKKISGSATVDKTLQLVIFSVCKI